MPQSPCQRSGTVGKAGGETMMNPKKKKVQEVGYNKICALSDKYLIAVDFNKCDNCGSQNYKYLSFSHRKNIVLRKNICADCGRRVESREVIKVLCKGVNINIGGDTNE